MPRPSRTLLTDLTGHAILSGAFERLRPRLLAMVERRVGHKVAARVDPEGVVQEAYLRARPRWQALNPKPADVDAWVYGQVVDRLIELVRAALGPQRDVSRDVGWPDGSVVPLAEKLVDSQTGPVTALSRAERCEMVRATLEQLNPIDREILGAALFRRSELRPNRCDPGPVPECGHQARPSRHGPAPRSHSARIPTSGGKPAVTTTSTDSESCAPGTPRAIRARAAPGLGSRCRPGTLPACNTRRTAETLRKLAEAMAMLQATPLRHAGDAKAQQADVPLPERFGPYRVLRSIGRGGMGEVYEAIEEPLGRHVAIKTLRRQATCESLLRRFDRERRTLARLHHTNIVPIYATGSEGDLLYFAMPYLSGASLGQVIKTARSHELSGNGLSTSSFEDLVHEAHSKTQSASDQPAAPGSELPGSPAGDAPSATVPSSGTHHLSKAYIRTAVQVMATVAEGLHHAHEAGVIHRDLKPANIIVEADGHAWVLDFGLAALKATSASAPLAFAVPLPPSESDATLTIGPAWHAPVHGPRAAHRRQAGQRPLRRLEPGRDLLRDPDAPAGVPVQASRPRDRAEAAASSHPGAGPRP